MSLNDQILIMVPILFVVVAEISTISRKIDLAHVNGNEMSSPFPDKYSFCKQYRNPDNLLHILLKRPTLGTFPILHAMNLSILYGSFIISLSIDSHNLATKATIGLIFFLLAFLPVIEITEYNKMYSKGLHIRSLHIHWIICISYLTLIYIIIEYWILPMGNFLDFLLFLIAILIAILLSKFFLHELSDELEQLTGNVDIQP